MSDTNPVLLPMLRLIPAGDENADSLAGVANDLDWLMSRVIEGTDVLPAEDIYATEDGRTKIHWISDPRINLSYIAIVGEALAETADLLARHMKILGDDELRDYAEHASAPADRIRAVHWLALSATPAFDEHRFRLLCRAFEDPDLEVRGNAVLAVSHVGWQQFEAPLRRLAAEDTDASVREDASTLLGNMQRYAAGSVVPR